MNSTSVGGPRSPQVVEKTWGGELIFENNHLYCSKLLFLRPNSKGSLHMHLVKDETFVVIEGTLTLICVDKEGEVYEHVLTPLDSFRIPPGISHQLCSGDETVIIMESSTFDSDEDSIRIVWGNT